MLIPTNITAISIKANKWFQKSYGNTYHRTQVTVFCKDSSLNAHLDSGMHYGYGEQWNQTALELFEKHFNLELPKYPNGQGKYSYLTSYARDNNIPLSCYVSDVARQKDL